MSTWKENRGWAFDLGGLSMHSYTIGGWPPHWKGTGFGEDDYTKVLQETLKMEPYIRSHSAIMDKYDPEKKVSLVVDEWGSWLAATPGTNPAFLVQQNSMRDALVAAININIFARHAKTRDGAIAIAVVNVDPTMPASVTLDVPGINARRAIGQTLTAARSDAVNTFDAPNTVAPKPVETHVKGGKLTLSLTPQSITVLVLEH